MRIAFLTNEYITEPNFDGGLANYLHRVALGLKKNGHEADIFVLTDGNGSLQHDGVTVHRIKYRPIKNVINRRLEVIINILYGAYLLKTAVLKEHKKRKIDIVEATNYLASGYFLVKSKAFPIVTRISYFGPFWRAANGRHAYLNEEFFIERLELKQLRRSQGVYSPSKILSELINIYEPTPIEVIRPSFVREHIENDYSLFDTYAKGLDYLLFYGSIMPLKGVDFLCDNLARILSENPTIHFVFIGRYGNAEQFKKAAGAFEKKVLYLDSTRKPLLLPFIQNARVIILPSKIDNLPNTCLESMAEGKVVLTTYTSGFEGIINNGVNGFLIKYGDNNQLCQCIKNICLMNNEELKNIGIEAKKTIFEEFSEEKNIDSLIKYFEKTICKWRQDNTRDA